MIYHHVYKFWLLSLLEDQGNFKEAANQARITQSALSQNLSALESVLQKSLVIRERGSISLTEDGHKVMSKIRPVLESLDFIDLSAADSTELKGNIRLGAYESIAVEYLPKLLKKIGSIHPELKFDLLTSRTEELLKLVRKGTLDMALVINGQEENKINSEVLYEDGLGLYISEKLAPYGRSLEHHKKLGLATISSGSDGHPLFYKRFIKKIPTELKTSVTCDSFETIRNFALTGAMIGLLPNRVAQRNSGLVKLWPLEGDEDGVSKHAISLVSRKNVSREYVDLIKKEFQVRPLGVSS